MLPFNYRNNLGRLAETQISDAQKASVSEDRRRRRLSDLDADLDAELADLGRLDDLDLWDRPLHDLERELTSAGRRRLTRRRWLQSAPITDPASPSDEADDRPDEGAENPEDVTPLGPFGYRPGNGVYPNGCVASNGAGARLSTGTSADVSRCRIVRIDLPLNQLEGVLATVDNYTMVETAKGRWGKDSHKHWDETNVLCRSTTDRAFSSELAYLKVLNLYNNDISGVLPDDVLELTKAQRDGAEPIPGDACLPRLEVLNLNDNLLTGRIPNFPKYEQLQSVGLGSADANPQGSVKGNNFHYPKNRLSENNRRVLEEYEVMFRNCEQQGTKCIGVPPFSCDAFGGFGNIYVPKQTTKGRLHCQKCPDNLLQLLIPLMIGLFCFSVGAVAAYAWLISRGKAATTKMWIASFSIVWYHSVTLSIIGDLRLNWPPSVKYLTSSLSISGMLGVDFVNPACILRTFGKDGFALFTMARLFVMFMVLFGTSTVSFGCATLRRFCYPNSVPNLGAPQEDDRHPHPHFSPPPSPSPSPSTTTSPRSASRRCSTCWSLRSRSSSRCSSRARGRRARS